MRPAWWNAAEAEADRAIEDFAAKVRGKLDESPEKIIRRKNPFLFRVRVVSDVHEFANMVTDAYLSSSEETMFGNVLEEVAVAICASAKNGRKSGIRNIDLEYDENGTRTIIQIKSGINWGNSSQHRALRRTFAEATGVLRQGRRGVDVRCVEGICYGKSQVKDRGTHVRLVGHCFWKDISNWDGTATSVMHLLGKHASNGLYDARKEASARIVNYLRDSGAVDDSDGIRWDELLELVMQR